MTMNSVLEQHGDNLRELHQLQTDLVNRLTDADLQLALPGDNPTLGEALADLGEWQNRYIQSFKTFRQDYALHAAPPDAATSVAVLKSWFAGLQAELVAAVSALSEADLQKPVDRGGFAPPAGVQFHIYREMLLIGYGRLDVYVKALGKTVSDQWRMWIG
jgi:hypothetical protein